jgi:hypothetical protein
MYVHAWVDCIHVHESMRLMIHGAELLCWDIRSTGPCEAQNKGNNAVLGSKPFVVTFVVIRRLLNWLTPF